MKDFLERLSTGAPSSRTIGPPTSSNGASSFHLFWDAPPVPLVEVSATVEVIEPPTVDKLFFWALQASFDDGGRRTGGAHLGLQYHPAYPDGGAVNWGGYRTGGGELDGSTSVLPSALDNVNTRTYRWYPHRRYRYRIHRSPERGWRGTVTDIEAAATTVVRDLWVDGDHLVAPMVWTEAFADCDDPSAAVRWSDFEVVTSHGDRLDVSSVRVNYQSYADGGCANTDAAVDGDGVVQRTGVPRRVSTGATLGLATG